MSYFSDTVGFNLKDEKFCILIPLSFLLSISAKHNKNFKYFTKTLQTPDKKIHHSPPIQKSIYMILCKQM